jgi:hypothetical protein
MKYVVLFEYLGRIYKLADTSNTPRDADTRVAKLERHGVKDAWWEEVEPWEEITPRGRNKTQGASC